MGVRALLDDVPMALGTLRGHPLRSSLTLLGIVIGAATVVTMTGLTEGFRERVAADLSQLGAGAFQVQKWPAVSFGHGDRRRFDRRPDLTRAQGEALRGLPFVAEVSIEAWQRSPERVWTRERATKGNVTVCGSTPGYERTNGVSIARGRFFSDADAALGRRVAVVGADVADALFPGEDAVGREVRLRSTTFEVVGVAERVGGFLGSGSRDAWVVVPIDAAAQVFGRPANHDLSIQATSPEDAPRAMDAVIARLRQLRGLRGAAENDFEVFSNESVSGTFDQLAAVVSAATFGVCALALLVGGIGIMNIMLVSVSERTREIGVRMALGARRRRVLGQFVLEAAALALAGGVAGVSLGAGLAVGARELLGLPASIPPWAVVLSLASASGSGLVFGVYPAVRASRLDPVEAMRAE